ncbi:hypothetical protein C356_04853 [Cryptococcus neoformans c45]|nr:hypothetical protein C356_04853 [Cryptococcus neoformans var. grubii c45]
MSDKVNDRALSVPVVIHYHRGGMLIGSKGDIYPSFMPVYPQSRKILLIFLNYRLLFPSSADDIIDAVAFHIYRFCRNRAIIHPVSKGLSLDTSPVSSLGPLAG